MAILRKLFRVTIRGQDVYVLASSFDAAEEAAAQRTQLDGAEKPQARAVYLITADVIEGK